MKADKLFFKRLQLFISDIKVNDCAGEEEKQMILDVCKSELSKKDISDRVELFKAELSKYRNLCEIEVLKNFYEYWTEPNQSKTKMRFELEKTWDMKRRLERWLNNNKNKNYVKQSITDNDYRELIEGR